MDTSHTLVYPALPFTIQYIVVQYGTLEQKCIVHISSECTPIHVHVPFANSSSLQLLPLHRKTRREINELDFFFHFSPPPPPLPFAFFPSVLQHFRKAKLEKVARGRSTSPFLLPKRETKFSSFSSSSSFQNKWLPLMMRGWIKKRRRRGKRVMAAEEEEEEEEEEGAMNERFIICRFSFRGVGKQKLKESAKNSFQGKPTYVFYSCLSNATATALVRARGTADFDFPFKMAISRRPTPFERERKETETASFFCFFFFPA